MHASSRNQVIFTDPINGYHSCSWVECCDPPALLPSSVVTLSLPPIFSSRLPPRCLSHHRQSEALGGICDLASFSTTWKTFSNPWCGRAQWLEVFHGHPTRPSCNTSFGGYQITEEGRPLRSGGDVVPWLGSWAPRAPAPSQIFPTEDSPTSENPSHR